MDFVKEAIARGHCSFKMYLEVDKNRPNINIPVGIYNQEGYGCSV